jgi:hypothetical protein
MADVVKRLGAPVGESQVPVPPNLGLRSTSQVIREPRPPSLHLLSAICYLLFCDCGLGAPL